MEDDGRTLVTAEDLDREWQAYRESAPGIFGEGESNRPGAAKPETESAGGAENQPAGEISRAVGTENQPAGNVSRGGLPAAAVGEAQRAALDKARAAPEVAAGTREGVAEAAAAAKEAAGYRTGDELAGLAAEHAAEHLEQIRQAEKLGLLDAADVRELEAIDSEFQAREAKAKAFEEGAACMSARGVI
jgi:hypothetical protein